ncbi:MAG: hypothetical protein KA444_10575 [Bacteroidia bacterium]|nr:hypothetical protein [Bacteroidia bacterium]
MLNIHNLFKKGKEILLLTSLLFLYSISTFAQDPGVKKEEASFIVLYTTGKIWDKEKSANEQNYFTEHSAYLSQLRKSNKIKLGGRYSDTGMILIVAKDQVEADDLVSKDPAIINGLFNAQVFPFSAFYGGCVK